MHNLQPVRPPLWIDEIPWHEMDVDGELVPRCQSPEGRQIEEFFRQNLFQWKHFQADKVMEDTYYLFKAYTDSGIGLNIREKFSGGRSGGDADDPSHICYGFTRETRVGGMKSPEGGDRIYYGTTWGLDINKLSGIVSHHYEDILDTEEKVDALTIPEIQARPDIDEKNLEYAQDVLDGILPVKFRGSEIQYCPWDDISQLRGVENCLLDMLDRPEFIHRTAAKFNEIYMTRYEQMEEQGLLEWNTHSLHCVPAYCDDVPAKDFDGVHVRFKDVWFRGMAQIFSSASPAMQDEFDLQYSRKMMEKCAVSYYGCCEPLHRAIPYLKKIPTMRKIGVSPWSDARSSAEQTAGAYVLACKLNPAGVSGQFNRAAVEKESADIIEACLAYKCPYEFVLKDISTVSGRPQNMFKWTETVIGVIDRYYGKCS
jgi:hypothetical protein